MKNRNENDNKIVGNEKPQRRGSVGSLDSGMSISFQSTSASTGSRCDAKARLMQQQFQQLQQSQQPNHAILGAVSSGITPVMLAASGNSTAGSSIHPNVAVMGPQNPSFLGGIFNKRERKLSKSDEGSTNNTGRSTEV